MDAKSKHGYWLPSNTWSLIDILATESISPLEFYSSRTFGSKNINSFGDLGEVNQLKNCLTLYPNDFNFQPSQGNPVLLYIKHDAVDEEFLKKDENGLAYYPKTIYLRKGNFQIRFVSEEDRTMFLANSTMSLEMKTLNKYHINLFNNGEQGIFHVIPRPPIQFQFNFNQLYMAATDKSAMAFDKAYNQIKGLIYGFVCGTEGKKSKPELDLTTTLGKIKNKVTNLRTYFGISETYDPAIIKELKEIMEEGEFLWIKYADDKGHDFHAIKIRLNELQELQILKLKEIKEKKDFISGTKPETINELQKRIDGLKAEKMPLEKQRQKLWDERDEIYDMAKTLNGRKKGPEKDLKKELKEEIHQLQTFINSITNELKPINAQIRTLEEKLSQYHFDGRTQFDGTIDELFYRISSTINTMILSIPDYFNNRDESKVLPSLTGFSFDINSLTESYMTSEEVGKIVLKLDSEFFQELDELNKEFLGMIIEIILLKAGSNVSGVSDFSINEVLKTVAEQAKSLGNNQINEVLDSLLQYRMTRKGKIIFPEDQIVLRSFVGLVMKPYSAEELIKFHQSKGFNDPHIIYPMWGAFVGFADMPKTFTNSVLQDADNPMIDQIDDYLFSNFLN